MLVALRCRSLGGEVTGVPGIGIKGVVPWRLEHDHIMHRYLLPFLLLLSFPASYAAHFTGGTISYRCVGTNIYEINMVIWRDCIGNDLLPQTIQFASDCGLSFNVPGLLPVTVEDVSALCASELGNSTCNGGPQPGLEAWHYSTTQFLSPCAGWTISWSTCCRNNTLNVTGSPGLYVETRLNTIAAPCNSSPVYTDPTMPYICINQTINYDAGVVNTSGNTLRHRFIEARYATPVPFPVNYLPPHYYDEPWTGMVIDSLTGVITFTPNTLGQIITAIQVDEYNANGVWIGSVMRDFLFTVVACDNALPDIDAGTITSLTGAGMVIEPYEFTVCSNGEVCLELLFTDPDIGQSISLTSNVGEVLPGANLGMSGTNPVTLTLCWIAADADAGVRQFSIAATDDACPIVGVQHYTYLVEITEPPYAGGDGSAMVCSLEDPFALIDSLVTPADGGTWTDPNGEPHNGIMVPGQEQAGAYTYSVSSGNGCVGSAEVLVSILPESDPVCISLSMEEQVVDPTWTVDIATGELVVQGLRDRNGMVLSGALYDASGRLVVQSSAMVANNAWRLALGTKAHRGLFLLRLGAADADPVVLAVLLDQ